MQFMGNNRQKDNSTHAASSGIDADPFCPIITMFQSLATDVADRQDTRERLCRQSRDVAIESKRIIFLLHSGETNTRTKDVIVFEANDRIRKLINNTIQAIALDLSDKSTFLYHKSITAGLQEFVEARSLLSYVEQKQIISLDEIRNELTFTLLSGEGRELTLPTHFFQPEDYMLGLADLSGEVMRKAIIGMSTRDTEGCAFARDVIRELYTGFMGVSGQSRAMQHKLETTRTNMLKVELAMFTFRVRRRDALKKLMQELQLPPLVEPDQPDAEQSAEPPLAQPHAAIPVWPSLAQPDGAITTGPPLAQPDATITAGLPSPQPDGYITAVPPLAQPDATHTTGPPLAQPDAAHTDVPPPAQPDAADASKKNKKKKKKKKKTNATKAE